MLCIDLHSGFIWMCVGGGSHSTGMFWHLVLMFTCSIRGSSYAADLQASTWGTPMWGRSWPSIIYDYIILMCSATNMQPLGGFCLQFPQRKSDVWRIQVHNTLNEDHMRQRLSEWVSIPVWVSEWVSEGTLVFWFVQAFYNIFAFFTPGHRQARVNLNYVQVYQERCYDLLQPASTKPLRVRGLLRLVTNTN
jgi:hypothetical protein